MSSLAICIVSHHVTVADRWTWATFVLGWLGERSAKGYDNPNPNPISTLIHGGYIEIHDVYIDDALRVVWSHVDERNYPWLCE
jgi:hypothetical protein